MADDLGEVRMRLRTVARIAALELEPAEVDGRAALLREGEPVALGWLDLIAFPLPPDALEGLTGIEPGPHAGWTAVQAWQPELPAGEGLTRLAAALRRAAARR